MNNLQLYVLLMILTVSSLFAGMKIIAESPRYKLGDQALEMIEDCEVSLPRNTFCTLYAKETSE